MANKLIGKRAIGSDRFIGGHITGMIVEVTDLYVVIMTDSGWHYECPKATLTYL